MPRLYVVAYEDLDETQIKTVLFGSRRADGGGRGVGSMYNTPGKARAQASRLNNEYADSAHAVDMVPPNARVLFVDTEDMMPLGAVEVDDPIARAEAKALHYGDLMTKLEKGRVE